MFSRLFSQFDAKTSDDQLMAAIAEGQPRAFEVLFERHGGKLVGYGLRLLGDRDRAEDLAQDVWMKVIHYADRYTPQGQFIAWVYTMLRHAALSELRRQRRLDFNERSDEQAVSDWNPTEELEKSQNLEELRHAIDQLPERQRIVIVMALVEELSYEEIAQALEISLSSVKSLLFRARQNLHKALAATPTGAPQ